MIPYISEFFCIYISKDATFYDFATFSVFLFSLLAYTVLKTNGVGGVDSSCQKNRRSLRFLHVFSIWYVVERG
jgi:hypothetical protein